VATHDGTVVVNYNSSTNAPNNYSGLSYSNDGGVSFTEIRPSPLATGHGFNFGDPIASYRAKDSRWYVGDLATGCGGFGIGLWKSTDGSTWTPGVCAHSGSDDDRDSMWVDNSPNSPSETPLGPGQSLNPGIRPRGCITQLDLEIDDH
jgi:hypothetical protein